LNNNLKLDSLGDRGHLNTRAAAAKSHPFPTLSADGPGVTVDFTRRLSTLIEYWANLVELGHNPRQILEAILKEEFENPDAEDEQDGYTALTKAVYLDSKDAVIALLDHAISVNKTTGDGVSPLMIAVQNDNSEIMDLLLKNNADVNQASPEGFTPLAIAAQEGHVKLAKTLLNRGANISARVVTGETPLLLAVHKGHRDMVKFLIENGASRNDTTAAGMSAAHIAAVNGNTLMLRLLSSLGFDLSSRTMQDGTPPIIAAAAAGQVGILHALMQLDREIRLDETNDIMLSPFHVAASEGNLEVMEFLYMHGCDIDIQDEAGATPLFRAVQHNRSRVLRWLVKVGARVNSPHSNGDLPLHVAIQHVSLPMRRTDFDRRMFRTTYQWLVYFWMQGLTSKQRVHMALPLPARQPGKAIPR